METTTVEITKETIDLSGITDKETCYLCQSKRVVDACHFCERPICGEHERPLPHWRQLQLSACPPCHGKHGE